MQKKEIRRGRPKGQKHSTKHIVELTKHTVNTWKHFLPEHYNKYVIQELELINYPLEGEELKRRIHGVIQSKIGDLLIALAIKRVGRKFKEAKEELENELI